MNPRAVSFAAVSWLLAVGCTAEPEIKQVNVEGMSQGRRLNRDSLAEMEARARAGDAQAARRLHLHFASIEHSPTGPEARKWLRISAAAGDYSSALDEANFSLGDQDCRGAEMWMGKAKDRADVSNELVRMDVKRLSEAYERQCGR
jgi:hypothetical protein